MRAVHATQPRPAPVKGYLSVAAAAALWGISGTLAKFLFGQEVSVLLLVDFRMTLSFLILLVALAVLRPGLLRVPRGEWGRIAVWSLLGLAPVQFAYYYAIEQTNVATAIFLQYLASVLTALYARLVQRERLAAPLVAGVGLALGGSALLVFGGGSGLRLSVPGVLAGLAAAAFLSFYTIYGSTMAGRLSSWTLLLWGLGVGSLPWHLLLPPWRAVSLVPEARVWWFFVFIAVFATVVPFGLYLYGLQHLHPTPATITGTLEPVVGAAAAWMFLGEALRAPQLLGALLVLVAVLVVSRWRTAP